jgi:hypothetical protein
MASRIYPDASWWIKYDQGKEHLTDLQGQVAPYAAGRKHLVTRQVESKGKQREWVYRVWFDAPDQRWAGVFGNFVFNMRAALDHIAVALNPPKERNSLIYFPMYRDNPWRFQPGTRRYVEREPVNRKNFLHSIKRMTEPAATYIYRCQPFVEAEVQQRPAEDHALAVLKSLNDTDKHRRLLVGMGGINGARVRYVDAAGQLAEGTYAFPEGTATRSGAELMRLPHEVNVEFMGSIAVGFGKRPNPVHPENLWLAIDSCVRAHLLNLEPEVLTPPEVPAHPTPPTTAVDASWTP